VQLLPNDVLLLCSDGLTDLVWNDEILEMVRTKSTLKEAARGLVDLANERGGHDNITVVLISVPSDFKIVSPVNNKKKTDWIPWLLGGIAGVLFLTVLASVFALNLLRRGGVTSTPAVSSPLALTTTPLPSPTFTFVPTLTSVPDIVTPLGPTLTPWPTNTVTP
jgi:hypothetical protein